MNRGDAFVAFVACGCGRVAVCYLQTAIIPSWKEIITHDFLCLQFLHTCLEEKRVHVMMRDG